MGSSEQRQEGTYLDTKEIKAQFGRGSSIDA